MSTATTALPLATAAAPTKTSGPRAWSRRVAIDIVGFLDVAGVLGGGLIPAIVYATHGGMAISFPVVTQAALLTALFCYLFFRHFGLYDVQKIHDLPASPGKIVAALGLGFLAALGLGMPFVSSSPNFWMWYSVWAVATTISVLTTRLAARHVLARMTIAGMFDARVAVYGFGHIAGRLEGYLRDPAHAIRLVGVFDDRKPQTPRDRHGRETSAPIANASVAGNLDDLMRLGRAGAIDQIIVALPQAADKRTAEIARRLEQLPVSLHVVTHIASDILDEGPAHGVSHIGPVGLIDVKTKPLGDWGRYVKTAEDYVVGALALAVLAPVMGCVALAVKLDSPGPVLFRQRRHGLNRRVIEVLKFRTMNVMEDGTDVKQAVAGDVRVTRLGRFLRSTSLDELPQLVNVLRGDMSLIGPRPHALVHDDHFDEMLEGYANRHQVKPGMTGWAQVHGFRGPTDNDFKMRARVEHDLWYIDNWSLWLDLRILAMTIAVGLRHKNAL